MSSDFVMPWGKYKNKTMEEIPSGYLKWLAENAKDDDVAEAADTEYNWRSEWKRHWFEE